ncbi:MAG: hypothetical protein MUF64_32450 [Polyangiaceae bacterium]|jgi:hypothetical protein|nr:hypothetical protein [Polyangiaceae bacterium]
MGLVNPTLREEGPTPGSAAGWTMSSVTQAQRIAAFGPAPHRAAEDFERWAPFAAAFEEGDLVMALFDPLPEGVEDFEEAWLDGPLFLALGEAQLAQAAFGGALVEAFDLGWPGSPFAASWANVGALAALFGAAPEETFAGWFPSPAPAFTGALFAGNQAAESFAGAWPAASSL